MTQPTANSAPITGSIGNGKKCSVLVVEGKPQLGENPHNQIGN